MNRKKPVLIALLILVLGSARGAGAAQLVVHEWGRFTSLQDELGCSVCGINDKDEAVPDFVHELKEHLLVRPERLPPVFYKRAPFSFLTLLAIRLFDVV